MTGSLMMRSLSAVNNGAMTMFLPLETNMAGDGLYLFQGVEAIAGRDRAPAKVGQSLTKVGDPTFEGSYVEGGELADYFDSILDEAETYTAFMVMASDATFVGSANQPIPFGNFNGSSGSSMFVANHSTLPAPASRVRNNFYTTGGNNLATVNVADTTQFAFYASRVSAVAGEMDDLTHGFGGDAITPTGGRVLAPSRKMRWLNSFSPSALGRCKLAAGGYFPDRYMTFAQVQAIHARIKAYLAQPSINIPI